MKAVGDELQVDKTLLGVDLYHDGRLIGTDLNESQLLAAIEGRHAKIVVTVIGGQGYIFGRGNQQLSPKVIQAVGRDNIMVIATLDKLHGALGQPACRHRRSRVRPALGGVLPCHNRRARAGDMAGEVMSRTVWVNGRLEPAGKALLTVTDRGFQVGDGIFETIRVVGGRVLEFSLHLSRLQASAVVLEIPLPDDLSDAWSPPWRRSAGPTGWTAPMRRS